MVLSLWATMRVRQVYVEFSQLPASFELTGVNKFVRRRSSSASPLAVKGLAEYELGGAIMLGGHPLRGPAEGITNFDMPLFV
jgi:hypothetical protein